VKKFPAFYGTRSFITVFTKTPPLVPILREMHSFHTFQHYLPNSDSNITFPSTYRSSVSSFPFRFFDKNFACLSYLSHACYMPRPSHPLDLITLILFAGVYSLWSTSLCSLLQPPATSSQVQIFSSAPCSQTHLSPSLSVTV